MSITITITADTPMEVRGIVAGLFGGDVPAPAVNITSGVSDGPSQVLAETPKTEPEIVPPKRTRTTKKADTVIQPDVTDIDEQGDPVPAPPADEFAGKSADEIAELLKPLMMDAVKAKGQDAVFAILAEFKVKNRSEAAKLSNAGEFAARLRKEVV